MTVRYFIFNNFFTFSTFTYFILQNKFAICISTSLYTDYPFFTRHDSKHIFIFNFKYRLTLWIT